MQLILIVDDEEYGLEHLYVGEASRPNTLKHFNDTTHFNIIRSSAISKVDVLRTDTK
jgi:hypothetical protein